MAHENQVLFCGEYHGKGISISEDRMAAENKKKK